MKAVESQSNVGVSENDDVSKASMEDLFVDGLI